MDSEVLIYIQKVKQYLKTDTAAHEYFIGQANIDEFLDELSVISEKNYQTNGQAALTEEQFELLRITIKAIALSKQKLFYSDDGLFMFFENYDPIGLN